MNKIKNRNIKRLVKKLSNYESFYESPRSLRQETLGELKFARLIVPSSEDTFVEFIEDNLYVFTDLKEFNKVYKNIYEPAVFELLDFGNVVYSSINYLIINNTYKIHMQVIWDAIEYELSYNFFIDEYSHKYNLEDTLNLINSFDNTELIEYLDERTYIQSYYNLFSMMEDSVLFTEIDVENAGEERILNSLDVNSYFNIQNDYIVTYTDLDSFDSDYFSVVDMFELISFVIYYQVKGIIIKTQNNELKLSRKQLLKHFDKLRDGYYKYNRSNTFGYIFRVGADLADFF